MADADAQSTTTGEGNSALTVGTTPAEGQSSLTVDNSATTSNGAIWQGLSDEVRGKVERFKDANALATSYSELLTQQGQPYRLPKSDASPEVRSSFRQEVTKLERPESSDGYQLDNTTVLPQGLKIPESWEQDFRKHAHELGLSQEQAATMHKQAMTNASDRILAETRQRGEAKQAAESALRKQWGGEFDAKVAKIKNGVQSFANRLGEEKGAQLIQKWNEGPGGDPTFLEMFDLIMGTMAEDTLVDGGIVPRRTSADSYEGRTYENSPEMTGARRFNRAG